MAPIRFSAEDCLAALWGVTGTDLIIVPGTAPRMRVDGQLVPVPGAPRLAPEDTEAILRSLLTQDQWLEFTDGDLDFSFTWRDLARIRGNAYRQRGSIAIVLRMMPNKIPSFDDLGLPQAVREFAKLSQGVVLVTGPTGSGKSTTLASLVDWINHNRAVHILTIEDPIEYVHWHKKAMITQRSIGEDADSFATALRSAMREDPDTLHVAGLLDQEPIGFAISMAKTGHLVFATLHTTGTVSTVDRLLDAFPIDQQNQVRMQLSGLLTGVVYQRLLPRIGGGQVGAFEVLIANTAIRTLIRDSKTNQIRNELQLGAREGMQTLENSLNQLIADGLITYEDALARTDYPREIVSAPPAGR
ncbi:MAG: PilT/PilU family type 4a pilus ATPase [Actinomycetes bacterium]